MRMKSFERIPDAEDAPLKDADDSEGMSRRRFLRRGLAAAGGLAASAVIGRRKEAGASGKTDAPLSEHERAEHALIRERITSERHDIVFSLRENGGTPEEMESEEDALIIVDWQEKFVSHKKTANEDVIRQLADTEQAIVQRIERAKQNSIPILAFGDSDGHPAEAKTRLLARDDSDDIFRERYTHGIRAALEDYAETHYFLKRDNSIAAKEKTGISPLEVFLKERGIRNVRLTGANEFICVKWSAQDLLYNKATGDEYTVVLSPAELADSEDILKKYDARSIYAALPRKTLFLRLLDEEKRMRSLGASREEAFRQVMETPISMVISVREDKNTPGKLSKQVLRPIDLKYDLEKFFASGVLPDFF